MSHQPVTTLPNEHATVPTAVRNLLNTNTPRTRMEAEAAQQARNADIGYVRRWVNTTRASMILRIINWFIAVALLVFGSLWYFKYVPVPSPVFAHEKFYVIVYGVFIFLTSLIPLCVVGYSHPKKRRAMWITWAVADAIAVLLGTFVLLYMYRKTEPKEYNMMLVYKTVATVSLSAVNMILDSVQARRLLKY